MDLLHNELHLLLFRLPCLQLLLIPQDSLLQLGVLLQKVVYRLLEKLVLSSLLGCTLVRSGSLLLLLMQGAFGARVLLDGGPEVLRLRHPCLEAIHTDLLLRRNQLLLQRQAVHALIRLLISLELPFLAISQQRNHLVEPAGFLAPSSLEQILKR